MATKQIYIPKELASGYGFTAPLGTTPLPDDPTQELPSAFVSFGRIGTDGITRGFDSESEDLKDMFGNTVATATTTDSETFQLKMIDVNETSLGTFYGSAAVTALDGGGYRIVSNGSWAVARTYAFRVILEATDTTVTYGLIVIPNGKVSTRGEQTIKGAALVEHDVTITALPDDSGNRAYLYISAPQPVTPPEPGTTYTITYNANGGEGSVSPQVVNAGESVTLSDGAAFTYDGRILVSYVDDNTTTPYELGATITPNADMHLTCNWAEAVTLTFDPVSSSYGESFTKEFPAGVAAALPTWAECQEHDWINSGKHADGWYTSDPSDPAADPYTATIAETFYAIWVND